MNNSVEARVPFLDNDLFKFCFSLDNNYKIKNTIHRWVWKKTFNKLGIKTKNKKSITDPQKDWFKTTLKELFEDEINSQQMRNSDFSITKILLTILTIIKKANSAQVLF